VGCRVWGVGCVPGLRFGSVGFRVWGVFRDLRVWGSEIKVWGFRVWGCGIKVCGLCEQRLKGQGLSWFRVSEFGFRV
jgi:hypothetical protein